MSLTKTWGSEFTRRTVPEGFTTPMSRTRWCDSGIMRKDRPVSQNLWWIGYDRKEVVSFWTNILYILNFRFSLESLVDRDTKSLEFPRFLHGVPNETRFHLRSSCSEDEPIVTSTRWRDKIFITVQSILLHKNYIKLNYKSYLQNDENFFMNFRQLEQVEERVPPAGRMSFGLSTETLRWNRGGP